MYLTTIVGDEKITTRSYAPSPKMTGKNTKAENNSNSGSCLAIMVLRQYADRVRDAILHHEDDINQWNFEDVEEVLEFKEGRKEHVDGLKDGRSKSSDRRGDHDEFPKTKKRPRYNDTFVLSQNQHHRHDENVCIVIPTPHVKGVRKARTGYILLLLQGVFFTPPKNVNCESNDNQDNTTTTPLPSISDLLPAIARQQISWVSKLTRRLSVSSSSVENDLPQNDNSHDAMGEVAQGVCKHLSTHYSININIDKVRVDTYPKELSAIFCRALQREAKSNMIDKDENEKLKSPDTIDENDPYSGPITLTKSATLATYVVTVIQHESSSAQPSNKNRNKDHAVNHYYWGISTKEEHWSQLNGKLNDHAASDVWIEPTDPNTGEDLILESKHGNCDEDGATKKKKKRKMYITAPKEKTKDGKSTVVVPVDAPVSRAYYKLAQVWDDVFFANVYNKRQQRYFNEQWRKDLMEGAGLDLGAAPGGWTQVLRTRIGLSKVVSVDPGVLAQRVRCLPNVHHIMSDFTSSKAVHAIAQHAPYSWIVCDASIDSNELLPKISSTLEKASTVLATGNALVIEEQADNDNDATTQTQKKKPYDDSCINTKPEIKAILSLPAVMVITLKLPYKTASSLERNLQHVISTVPCELKKIASIVSKTSSRVDVSFCILHLMANSDSERTIVAVFDNKMQNKERE